MPLGFTFSENSYSLIVFFVSGDQAMPAVNGQDVGNPCNLQSINWIEAILRLVKIHLIIIPLNMQD